MTRPLKPFTGLVSELSIYVGEDNFIRSTGHQSLGVGAAAMLASAGLAGAAVGASIASTSTGDSVEFFSCKVGDVLVNGVFTKASFKNGDELTVVTEPSRKDSVFVLAAQRAHDQMLWLAPHCSRGLNAHKRFCLRMALWVLLAILCAGAAFNVAMEFATTSPRQWGFDPFAMAVIAAMSLLVAPYYGFRFYGQWRPTARRAESIFAALGYRDPSNVDLPRDHKQYCKARGIKWPYLTDGGWIYHYVDLK